MSSGSQKEVAGAYEELERELRQFHGLSATFFRAAAARTGMTITDMQVLDILASAGPATAGQLADLTGLTTGAITGMLNRLEESGLVRRERDPNDGRRVIVRLEKGTDETSKLDPVFASLGRAWHELATEYNAEQVTFLLDFLKRSNGIARREIVQLREAPESEGGVYSVPLGNIGSGQFVVSSGLSRLTMRASRMDDLYQARFEGPPPDVKVKDGVVTVRYPRRLLTIGGLQRGAEVKLNAAIPWNILVQGGASELIAELDGLKLASLEIKGGLSSIRLELPMPTDIVPIRFSGGAADVTVRRPAHAAARVRLKGWASEFIFDDQVFSDLGNNVRMQSSNFDPAAPFYDIDVASSVSMVRILTTSVTGK